MNDVPSRQTELREKPSSPVTFGLVGINAFIFLLQLSMAKYHPRYPLDYYFALSLDGIRHGYLWQLISFQFMHGGFGHIIFNCWAIYVFGRVVEISLGGKKMLQIYLASGVIGGLFQIAGSWLLPGLFGDWPVVGASAGAFGLIASFAMMYPREKLYLLLFFVIPLKLKATTLLWLSLAIAILGITFPLFENSLPQSVTININGVLGGNVAHAAHLGGIIAGCFFTRQLMRRYRARASAAAINSDPGSSMKITPAQD